MKDLTVGKPMKVIFMFALPMILGQFAQQMYSFCDSAIVGNFVSPNALAAVGATSVVSNMMIGFLNNGTMGLAIPIAKYYGAKDYRNMRKCIKSSALITLTATILLTLFGLLFIGRILSALGTPDDIFDMANQYVLIIIAGMFFCSLYNLCANVLRAVGDSKTPLVFLGISVVTNILLDLLFIKVFGMGVSGAAIATVISQALSGILSLIFICTRAKHLLPQKGDGRAEKSDVRDLIQSALAMGFMSCIVNIGTVILQKAINGLGTDIITAHTSARKVFDLLTVVLYIVGNAVTTFVSQNMGAGKYDRVKKGIRDALIINISLSTVIIILGWLVSNPLIRLVSGTSDPAVIEPAVRYIRISVSCFYVLAPVFVLRCAMQGMGRKIVPIMSSLMELVGKILAVMLLTPRLGYLGVTITEPIIWACCTLMLTIVYLVTPVDKLVEKRGLNKPQEAKS
jgi:putative MATE family efflux protein